MIGNTFEIVARAKRVASFGESHTLKVLSRPEWTILLVILVYSFIPAFGGLFRILELVGGPAVAPENLRALAAPLPIVLHILSSSLFCLFGVVPFLPSIRRHRPVTHRVLGRAVAIAGCISAATGVWMTHFFAFPDELQGNMLYWVRIILGFSMVGLIGWAVIAIRSRNIFRHGASMLRAYAIGQGASTQSFLGIGWIVVAGTEPLGPLRDGMMVFAWVLNMLVAEYLIGKFLTPTKLSAQRLEIHEIFLWRSTDGTALGAAYGLVAVYTSTKANEQRPTRY